MLTMGDGLKDITISGGENMSAVEVPGDAIRESRIASSLHSEMFVLDVVFAYPTAIVAYARAWISRLP